MRGSVPSLSCALLLASVTTVFGALRTVEHSYTLPVDGKVVVDAYNGAIRVSAKSGSRVEVKLVAQSGDEDAERGQKALDALEFTAKLEGSVLTIRTRNPKEGGARFLWEERPRLVIAMDIVVPRECDLDLKTKVGGIEVDPIVGDMRARAESGSIFFRGVTGDLRARTTTGAVVVSRCLGSVDLKTRLGDVRVGTVEGAATLETANGDVDLQTARGPVSISVASGDVTVGFGRMKGNSTVKTGYGNIAIGIAPEIAFTLRADARWGEVVNTIPLDAAGKEVDKHHVTGTIRGGGPLLVLKTKGGNVSIETAEPLFAE